MNLIYKLSIAWVLLFVKKKIRIILIYFSFVDCQAAAPPKSFLQEERRGALLICPLRFGEILLYYKMKNYVQVIAYENLIAYLLRTLRQSAYRGAAR